MLRRRYPTRKKGEYQTAPVTSLRFSQSSQADLASIYTLLQERWQLKNRPTISLLLQGVLSYYAETVKSDPAALKSLRDEILARGGATGRRNQFKRDAETFAKEASAASAAL